MPAHKLDTASQVFFYEQEFYVLSNFSAFRLKWHGVDFDTSEHAYQWSKFSYPGNSQAAFDAADAILKARSAHEAFKIAEQNRVHINPDWNRNRVDIMRQILFAKAEQHEYVKRKLLETGTRELIEDSWRDPFWGWGGDRRGQNVLGKLWMGIRDELMNHSRFLKIVEDNFQSQGWDISYNDDGEVLARRSVVDNSALTINLSQLARQIGGGK